MKRRILVTTGTRAEYGILYPILNQIIKSKKLELLLVVTGSHLSKKFGFSIKEIRKDKIPITATIPMIPKYDTNYSMSTTLGEGIIKFSKVFKKLQPDINLVLGDRDEMLASALVASHLNIPNIHIHGGDISGGIDEYNRHAITKLSNIHFAGTKMSAKRIIRMGENPKFVFFSGSPSIDDLKNKKITTKKELENKFNIKFSGNEILLLQHSVTTESDLSEKQILDTLKAIVKIKQMTFVIAPNSDAGNKNIFKQLKIFANKYDFINMYTTLPRKDYLGFLKQCKVLVGNSSSGMIEASYFNTMVVNIGNRQKNRERGPNVIEVKNSVTSIHNGILLGLKKQGKLNKNNIYGNGNAGKKIVKFLENVKINKELINKQLSY